MIERREAPSYDSDPGTGVSIERIETADDGPQVRVGLTWDGAERMTCWFPIAEVEEELRR